jgi:hypothetical protein
VHSATKESVDVLVIWHAQDEWSLREFAGLVYRLSAGAPAGQADYARVDGHPVLNVKVGLDADWRRYVAWTSAPNLTVVVSASDDAESDLAPFASGWLKGFPARDFKDVVERHRHVIVIEEVERCLRALAAPKMRGVAAVRISELTFFLPEGRRDLQGDLTEAAVQEFPSWWMKNRDRTQCDWLRDRVGQELRHLGTYVREGALSPALATTAVLRALVGLPLPPWTVKEPADLQSLGDTWARFWKAASDQPRDQWGREAIDLWIDYLRRLLRERASPSGLWSGLTDLIKILKSCDPKPVGLVPLPHPPVTFTEQFGDEVSRALNAILRWWGENRLKAHWRSGGPVLFEGGPEIRLGQMTR